MAGVVPGDSVVIYGAGPVGLMAALSATIKGASNGRRPPPGPNAAGQGTVMTDLDHSAAGPMPSPGANGFGPAIARAPSHAGGCVSLTAARRLLDRRP